MTGTGAFADDAAPMSTEVPHAQLPAPTRRRRRWWRRSLLVLALLIPMLLAAPYAIALGPVRGWVERRATLRLGAPCGIDDLSFSWASGVTVQGLEIGNPPGFPSERPCLRVRELTFDLARSLSLGVNLRVDGLLLSVEQGADGTTNLQRLGGASAAPPPLAGAPPPRDEPASLAIDVALQNGRIEIRREGRLLEVAQHVSASVVRAPASPRTSVAAAADLQAGRTSLTISHERDDGAVHGELVTPGLDLARWQPLVQTFVPGQVTTLAGTVAGSLTFDLRADGELETSGTLSVAAPQLGGPLVGGLLLGGATWTVTPALTIGRRDGAPGIDARRAVVDLGWLQLRGREPDPAATAPQLAFAYDLDVAALAAFDAAGDVLPATLRGSGARLTGDVSMPAADLPHDVAGWTREIAANARFVMPKLVAAGFEFLDVQVTADLRDGTCHLATADATRLDGGPLSLAVLVDLTQPATLPTTATLRWQGGALHGGTASLLRYVLPLLAGVGDAQNALTGSCDLELGLAGPALRGSGDGWITWLDSWRGSGSLGLRDAAFAPVPALQGLLQPLGPLNQAVAPLGDGGRLRLDTFTAPFTFADGVVRTTAGRWLSKGRSLGLSGSVGLAGALDYELDLTALLRGHRDGERVLALLSGALPPAAIQGSLDAPKLQLPAIDVVLQRALENELKQQGGGLLKKALDDLLKRR